MIGCDIVDVSRIEKLLETGFLRRVFCDEEREYLLSRPNPAQTAAGLFAAKEAVCKVLGTGISSEVVWQNISILHDAAGCPAVSFKGGAEEVMRKKFPGCSLFVTISHSDTTAVAVAMAARQSGGPEIKRL